jgi:hypothetical protein
MPSEVSKPPSIATVSDAKRQRLDALLDSYANDKITADVYHRERNKILAEP